MLLDVLNVLSYVPGLLGYHGLIAFMASFVLFVHTLVALKSDYVLTNAKGGSRREDGKDKHRERYSERMRKRYRQNHHRGDSNPCGAAPDRFRVQPKHRSNLATGHQSKLLRECPRIHGLPTNWIPSGDDRIELYQ